ncbi:MAG: zinc ABC transporter substrate-binding protein [Gammaproteobacteria bacterium]|nr:zinc ABC transporter substrate-binding protein [Gammaproteobacteria bacterium]
MSLRAAAAILSLAVTVPASAAGDSAAATTASAGRPAAVATISIIADMVRAVAGGLVTVTSIVHIGGDPHVYEPLPSDARALARADIVFRNGLGLERWLDKLIGGATARRPVVTVTDGLPALVQSTGGYPGDPDPHLWMDPAHAQVYVDNITAGLAGRFPRHAQDFRRNAADYRRRLGGLADWISAEVAVIPPARRKLVTTHDAFRYFGERFGFTVTATIWGISTEREPSAAEVAGIIRAVREAAVPAVFVETTVNPKLMQRIARDAGVTLGRPLYGDFFFNDTAAAETYTGMMRANTRAIVDALGE